VDNPTTHLELTMIHEAMILEYSGKRLALIEWASWNKLLFFFVLGAQLYLPWSKAATSEIGTNTISLLILAANVVLLILLLAFVESVIAKFRIFRVPDMIFTGLALGMIATLIIIFL
jgi:formate hydrogenlyase subunit 4